MYGKNPVAKAPTEQTSRCDMNAEKLINFPKKDLYTYEKRPTKKGLDKKTLYICAIYMQCVSPPSNAPCIESKETYIYQKETWIHMEIYPK